MGTYSSKSATAATTVASTSASATSKASSSATASSFPGLGLVDLDLLAIQSNSVHFTDGSLGRVLVVEGDEGIALASVVDISHLAKLLKLGLKKECHLPGQTDNWGVERIIRIYTWNAF